jgi:NAD kinase
MDRLTENKVVLVVRETRLEELKARFNTASQARFYVQQLGGDFREYEEEDASYRKAVHEAQRSLDALARVQMVHRKFLPNFIFAPEDVVVAIGQDGLVANTLKYLEGQPLIGVNPDPARYDGKLLPFGVSGISKIVPEVFRKKRLTKAVTMAKASLADGQTIYAVNDLFIGPKSHGSARYTIKHGERFERHSSSGVIVSTGMGSTGWFASLIAGANGVTRAFAGLADDEGGPPTYSAAGMPWDADQLVFTVREPFPSKTTQTSLVFGRIGANQPLILESLMAERGVIFSDGFETDFVEFTSGMRATIAIAERKGCLVV